MEIWFKVLEKSWSSIGHVHEPCIQIETFHGLFSDHLSGRQVSKWIRSSQENNGILVVTTLPSGSWMAAAAAKRSGAPTDTNLVIFSDDGRTGASNQSYLGKITPDDERDELMKTRSD